MGRSGDRWQRTENRISGEQEIRISGEQEIRFAGVRLLLLKFTAPMVDANFTPIYL
jgi:hypothetical protein